MEENDALKTQRKSLQKAKDAVQKDLAKVLREKEQLEQESKDSIQREKQANENAAKL